jgi:hypothetical protein
MQQVCTNNLSAVAMEAGGSIHHQRVHHLHKLITGKCRRSSSQSFNDYLLLLKIDKKRTAIMLTVIAGAAQLEVTLVADG